MSYIGERVSDSIPDKRIDIRNKHVYLIFSNLDAAETSGPSVCNANEREEQNEECEPHTNHVQPASPFQEHFHVGCVTTSIEEQQQER